MLVPKTEEKIEDVPKLIVLNNGVEIIARIVHAVGGDLIINSCKRLKDGEFGHYPLFSKKDGNISIKSHAITLICDVDDDVLSVYTQYVENY